MPTGRPDSEAPPAPLVDVAVPLPIDEPLTYRSREALAEPPPAGSRVRVQVGRRRLVGVVTGHRHEPPPGARLRPLEAVLDTEPVLPPSLLELARFISGYYLAPIGEVLRGMLPGELPPWGERRIWLTDAGALARPRSEAERSIVKALLERGRLPIRQLQGEVDPGELAAAVEQLVRRGWVAISEGGERRGRRYRTAVELPPGDLEAQLEACGRSAPGRAVVELLAGLGRPASIPELCDAVGCRPAVVQRLIRLGVLRAFTQVERLLLGAHVLRPRPAAELTPRPDQERAIATLRAAVEAGGYRGFLLQGITGSGKTEVYLRAAASALERGRSVILLVPEIALVPDLARVARERFGDRVAILHSALGTGERSQEWDRIRQGQARLVLGPRSAVFAPVSDLGLIVVDEEQDPSYKQEIVPRYHGRDLALVRARQEGATALLVSATPSLETRLNAERGKLEPLRLTVRIGRGELPEGVLIDLRSEVAERKPGEIVFSTRLREELEATLARGEQAILLRNRRGYAPQVLCRACGDSLRCSLCGLPQTYHRRDDTLLCHYCASRRPLPATCPACDAPALELLGAGTERVEEQFAELFPGVAVGVLDRDVVRRQGGAASLLERFASGELKVLVGTQMVAKGHHFPRVTLAAVLSADSYLGFPDFRAVERTYTLLTQLAGRAGRGAAAGRVLIQTFHPDHYAVQAALHHDDEGFAREEMRFRRTFRYPPYFRMVQLLWRDQRRERARTELAALAERIERHAAARGVRLLGPAPAPLERLKGQWRFQLFLLTESSSRLQRLLRETLPAPRPRGLVVDVDPVHLL